jgi:hypothetical protein
MNPSRKKGRIINPSVRSLLVAVLLLIIGFRLFGFYAF